MAKNLHDNPYTRLLNAYVERFGVVPASPAPEFEERREELMREALKTGVIPEKLTPEYWGEHE